MSIKSLPLRDIKCIDNYARLVLKNNSKRLTMKDWAYVGKDIKAKSERYKPVIAKRIIMSNLELANNRILEVLSRNNITENTPFELLNKAKEIAINKENSSDLIKIAKELIEIQDLKPQKVNISETRKEIDYNNLLPSEVKRTISTTKTIENDKKTDE